MTSQISYKMYLAFHHVPIHVKKKQLQPYILSVYLSGVTVRSRPMRTPQTYSLYLHLSLSTYTMYVGIESY